MKKYYMIEEWNPTGDADIHELNATTEAEARHETINNWNHMNTAERGRIRRLAFFQAEPEDVEEVNYEAFEDFYNIAEHGTALFTEIEAGTTYEDPEGSWEVVSVDGDDITVKNITEDDPNNGKEYIVSREEVEYFTR